MIILKHGRFISGSNIYKPGNVLPDVVGVQKLIDEGLAEVVADTKPAKQGKRRETEKAASSPAVGAEVSAGTQSVPPAPKNDEGNS